MRTKYLLLLLAISAAFGSCKQLKEVKNLSRCEFRMAGIDNVTLAGIDVQEVNSIESLSFLQKVKLTEAAAKGNLPLNFTIRVEARNPNKSLAAMNEIEWIVAIDDVDMAKGNIEKRIEVPPDNGTAAIPFNISINLKETVSKKSGSALLNFGCNLAGAGKKSSRVKLRIKPSIKVGRASFKYPGFINVGYTFSAGD